MKNELNRLRRDLEWFLTTDFDMHSPMPKAHMQGILIAIVLIIVVVLAS